MGRLAAQKVVGCCQALVLALPLGSTLVIVAQAHPLALLCLVGLGEANGKWRVQFSDVSPFLVGQSDL